MAVYFVLFYISTKFFLNIPYVYLLEVFLDGKVRIGRVSFELIRMCQN